MNNQNQKKQRPLIQVDLLKISLEHLFEELYIKKMDMQGLLR